MTPLIKKKLILIYIRYTTIIKMNFINKMCKIVKIPPTRTTRYRESVSLVLKNSLKAPSEVYYKPQSTFQTFNVIWNEDMTNFTLQCTTNRK